MKQFIKPVLYLAGLLLFLEVINLFSGRSLNQFAIIPRQLSQLPGIFISPFLHGSLGHFLSNILPFVIFSLLILQQGLARYIKLSLFLVFSTGLLVWLFARDAYHLGASGLIYGYFGYLVLIGFVSKQPRMLLTSILVALVYGGLIWGVLPVRGFVSWESHLFGLLCGLTAAKVLATRKTVK